MSKCHNITINIDIIHTIVKHYSKIWLFSAKQHTLAELISYHNENLIPNTKNREHNFIFPAVLSRICAHVVNITTSHGPKSDTCILIIVSGQTERHIENIFPNSASVLQLI